MRVLVICCLALAVLLGTSVNCFGNEIDVAKKQIADLRGYMAQLETAYVNVMNEFQEVSQEAVTLYKKADAIVKTKKKDFTCEEKLILVSAAYYEQYMQKLLITLKFIEAELYNTNEKLIELHKKLEGMKEA